MDGNHARFNPRGTGNFLFRNVKVTKVCPDNDDCHSNSTEDHLIGESVDTGISQVSAKMVDLDVDNQLNSMLFGLQIGIRAYKGEPQIIGSFKPAPFWGIYNDRQISGSRSMTVSYQSKLEDLTWGSFDDDDSDGFKSPVLKALKEHSEESLSIKFDLHHCITDIDNEEFTFGTINGTIGPTAKDQPENFVNGRLLRVTEGCILRKEGALPDAPTNLAPFVIHDNKLILDLGNAFARVKNDSMYRIDDIRLGDRVCLRTKEKKRQIGDAINLNVPWLADNILEFEIREDEKDDTFQLYRCPKEQLKKEDSDPTCTDVIMEETSVLVRPTTRFVRHMNPSETYSYTFFAYEKGKPKCGYNIPLKIQTNLFPDDLNVDLQLPNVNETERLKGLHFKVEGQDPSHDYDIFTNCSGMASVELVANSAGSGKVRRFGIDGQLFTVTYLQNEMQKELLEVGSTLTIHVFEKFASNNDTPSWWGTDGHPGVYHILKRYDILYPVMRPIVALADYYSVVKNKDRLLRVFSVDEEDPSYMPATRDLSAEKLDFIKSWLGSCEDCMPLLSSQRSFTTEEVCKGFQTALQLELISVPMYLYAYFSIKPGANKYIAKALLSVATEEMYHMSLVANILNAIEECSGPDIQNDNVIPVYPTPLPGGLRPELTLRLSRLSLGLIRDVFMEFEAPEHILFDDNELDDPHSFHHNTIGAFYERLKKNMTDLAKKGNLTFNESDSWQVKIAPKGNEAIVVTDLESAKKAIDTIVRQGEGTKDSPTEATRNSSAELSHYYKLAQIVAGHEMIKDNDSWTFTGPAINFDPNGVWPLPDNPRTMQYKENTRVRLLAEGFSRSYLDLLSQLQRAFNGEPKDIAKSFSTMVAFTNKAQNLAKERISQEGDELLHAGPPFDNPLDLFPPGKGGSLY